MYININLVQTIPRWTFVERTVLEEKYMKSKEDSEQVRITSICESEEENNDLNN